MIEKLTDGLRRGGVAKGEIFQHDAVIGAGEHFADGGFAIASGTAGLLRVVFERLREVVVIDGADVGFVDAHAEGDGGHDDIRLPAHEGILCGMPMLIRQARMVGEGVHSTLLKMRGDVLGGVLQRHIHDAGHFALQQQFREHGEALLRGAGGDADVQIGPQERGLHVIGLRDVEGLADVCRDGGRGGGGEGQNGPDAEIAGHMGKAEVFRAEVVPPLGDAVRFIDGHHRDFELLEPLDEVFIHEPLGGDVEQLQRAVPHVVKDLHGLRCTQRGIEPGGGDATSLQRLHLILHQSDERRDDERDAVHEQRRKLVAEGFTRTGGKKGQRTPPGEQRLHHLLLAGAESRMAEVLFQGGVEVVRHEVG